MSPAQNANDETPAPWYSDGLRFKCSQCGDCCTGAPGYVWVNKEEIQELADEIQVSVEQFESEYVRRVGIRKSLREFPSGDCVFFDSESRKCQVYNARPRQCRTWPFWDSNLKTPEAWELTCEVSPGSGRGKLYQLEEIEERRKVMKV
ncbi:MAG: YkgJ family cysteine cluster protein [Planctomycetales bacterium]|nr:YkgJ family cysteine cluster protein [Planctomycetales bacterium]